MPEKIRIATEISILINLINKLPQKLIKKLNEKLGIVSPSEAYYKAWAGDKKGDDE